MDEKTIEKQEEFEIDIPDIDVDELNVTIETKIRTILFFIAWINQIIAFFGAPTLDIDFGQAYGVVSSIVAFSVSVWAWWKNNSFTWPALLGDAAMNSARHAREEA